MSKPRMVPPRKPRGESVKTTIALQDKQIKMLTDRIVELGKLNDDNYQSAKQWRERSDELEARLKDARTEFTKLRSENDYSRGYISRVKETDSTGE